MKKEVLGAAFLPEDAYLIKKLARLRRESVSTLIRRAACRELVRSKIRPDSDGPFDYWDEETEESGGD
jgi:hypothetical protein